MNLILRKGPLNYTFENATNEADLTCCRPTKGSTKCYQFYIVSCISSYKNLVKVYSQYSKTSSMQLQICMRRCMGKMFRGSNYADSSHTHANAGMPAEWDMRAHDPHNFLSEKPKHDVKT